MSDKQSALNDFTPNLCFDACKHLATSFSFFFTFLTVLKGHWQFFFFILFILTHSPFLLFFWSLNTHLLCLLGRCPWKTEKGQGDPQTLGAYLTRPYRFCGNQPGSLLLRNYYHTGQRHLRWSAMLWIISCPWPAVWMDPQESQCLVCSPSAGSRSVFCLLW